MRLHDSFLAPAADRVFIEASAGIETDATDRRGTKGITHWGLHGLGSIHSWR